MNAPITHRLDNGLAAVLVPRPAAHRVSITVMVRVGSRFESAARNGASHCLEHLLFRGNAARPDVLTLHRAFDQIGSGLNATTGIESTEIVFTALPEHLREALAELAGLVRTPLLRDFEKERAIIQDEVLSDYNDQGLLIDLATLSAQLLWPEHPLGQSVTGTPQSIAALTADAVREHHRDHYHAANVVLGLAGRLEPERALAWVQENLGDWPAHPHGLSRPALLTEAARAGGPHVKAVPDADNQFHLQLSFPAPGYNDPREIPLMLLGRILDDGPATRLQRRIREELALVYGIGADYSGFQDGGSFDVSTSVKAERLPELLAALFGLLGELRRGGVTAEELALAKGRHRLELAFGKDSLSGQLERYAWPLLYSTPRDEATEWRLVEAVTAQEVSDLAAELFRPERLHLAVVGPLQNDTETLLRRAAERL